MRQRFVSMALDFEAEQRAAFRLHPQRHGKRHGGRKHDRRMVRRRLNELGHAIEKVAA